MKEAVKNWFFDIRTAKIRAIACFYFLFIMGHPGEERKLAGPQHEAGTRVFEREQ